MQLNPYLSFNGTCDAAFKFYEKALGGKILFKSTYGETPMAKDMPKEALNQIVHVRLEAAGNILMGSDTCQGYDKPQGFHVTLGVKTAEEAEKLFKALSENATTITMPIQETFWAIRFGMLVDQFGIPWMVNCEKPMA